MSRSFTLFTRGGGPVATNANNEDASSRLVRHLLAEQQAQKILSQGPPPAPPDNDMPRSAPKRPQSANAAKRKAQTRSASNNRPKTPTNGHREKEQAHLYRDHREQVKTLNAEDLASELFELKKKALSLEETISFLKGENHRLEQEALRQQRRIDQLMQLSEGVKSSAAQQQSVRREIEKSILVRQLKQQLQTVKQLVAERESEIDLLKRDVRATHVKEIERERDELLCETTRLVAVVDALRDELQRERQQREWSNRVAGESGEEMRRELQRLAANYQRLLASLSNKRERESEKQRERPVSAGPLRSTEKGRGSSNSNASATPSPSGKSTALSLRRAVESEREREREKEREPERDLLDHFKPDAFAEPLSLSLSQREPHTATERETESALDLSWDGDASRDALPSTLTTQPNRDVVVVSTQPLPLNAFIQPFTPPTYNTHTQLTQPIQPIQPTQPTQLFPGAKFRVGERIQAQYGEGVTWYDGLVRGIHHIGVDSETNSAVYVYEIGYSDGGYEKSVKAEKVRKPVKSNAVPSTTPSSVKENSSSVVSDVPAVISPSPTAASVSVPAVSATQDVPLAKFAVHQRVLSRYYQGDARYAGVVVSATLSPATRRFVYEVLYDDGEREKNVLEEHIEREKEGESEDAVRVKAEREREREKEIRAEREKEKEIERERQAEMAREKEKEREREREQERAREIEREREEEERVRERELEKEREREQEERESSHRHTESSPRETQRESAVSSLTESPRKEKDKERDRDTLSVGSLALVYFSPYKSFYQGTVRSCESALRECAVEYEDGDFEERVSLSRTLFLSPQRERERETFCEGERVMARFELGDAWFAATVVKRGSVRDRERDTERERFVYSLRFADGDEEHNVSAEKMQRCREEDIVRAMSLSSEREKGKKRETETEKEKERETVNETERERKSVKTFENALSSRSHNVPARFSVGTAVDGFFASQAWFPATVSAVSLNPQSNVWEYDLLYDDGDRESALAEDRLREREKEKERASSAVSTAPAAIATAAVPLSVSLSPSPSLFREGDAVDADYQGGGVFYLGRIQRVRDDGSFDVRYDDGDEEMRVPPERLRSVQSEREKNKEMGQEKEKENQSEKDKQSVKDKENEKEKEPPAQSSFFSSSPAVAPTETTTTFRVGEAVQGDFGGTSTACWYDAVVLAVHRESDSEGELYDLRYSDGDEERRVPLRRVRRPLPQPAQYFAADKIEGNYQAGGTWFGGRVLCASEGKGQCYDVLYEDGEEEKNVPTNRMRLVERAAASHSEPQSSPRAVSATVSLPAVAHVQHSVASEGSQQRHAPISTNLDSFLNDLSDDDDESGGGIGGLDGGNAVDLKNDQAIKLEDDEDEYGDDFAA